MTQVQVSEHLGVNPMTIKRWENGHNWPGDESLEALAELFEVPTFDFFLGPMKKKDLSRLISDLHELWDASK